MHTPTHPHAHLYPQGLTPCHDLIEVVDGWGEKRREVESTLLSIIWE